MNLINFSLVAAVVSNLLGATAGARDLVPRDLIGPGSKLTFTRDVDFGRDRTRTFCDGRPRALWMLSAGRCCSVVRGSPTAYAAQAVLKGQVPRTVNFVNFRRTKIMIDAASETIVRCRAHMISATYLRKAFGDALTIDQVVTPMRPPSGGRVEF